MSRRRQSASVSQTSRWRLKAMARRSVRTCANHTRATNSFSVSARFAQHTAGLPSRGNSLPPSVLGTAGSSRHATSSHAASVAQRSRRLRASRRPALWPQWSHCSPVRIGRCAHGATTRRPSPFVRCCCPAGLERRRRSPGVSTPRGKPWWRASTACSCSTPYRSYRAPSPRSSSAAPPSSGSRTWRRCMRACSHSSLRVRASPWAKSRWTAGARQACSLCSAGGHRGSVWLRAAARSKQSSAPRTREPSACGSTSLCTKSATHWPSRSCSTVRPRRLPTQSAVW
mmetsp:Transcript_2229/g.5010  ORF Transcript_2229/g.5010 Transcript_2229/m.5010 type:complete len:285 (+) Transcript_2229:392-1246(+)